LRQHLNAKTAGGYGVEAEAELVTPAELDVRLAQHVFVGILGEQLLPRANLQHIHRF
jgi:hypothetical protein